MRPIPVLAVVLTVAALGAAVQVLAGASPPHPALPFGALFSFAVSAFRGPLR